MPSGEEKQLKFFLMISTWTPAKIGVFIFAVIDVKWNTIYDVS